MRERVKVVTDGYAQLCTAFPSSVDDFVNPLVALSDDDVLRVVKERRDRAAWGSGASPLELRDTRRATTVLAEHGAAEVREFERWLSARRVPRARAGGADAPHMHPEVVQSKVAVMVAKNKLELDAIERVQRAVEARELEPREALAVTTSRIEAARVKRAVGWELPHEGQRSSATRSAVGGSARDARAAGSRRARRMFTPAAGAAKDNATAVQEIEQKLDELRGMVGVFREVAPVVDYDDMGECGLYMDQW